MVCRNSSEVDWRCSGDSWRSGAIAINYRRLASYDFADELLHRLARKDIFPKLEAIVVAGRPAGGQFIARCRMANQVHEKLGVTVTYVVSNPSSYAWPASAARALPASPRVPRRPQLSDDSLRKQLAARPVVYLLGELDSLPIAGFDSSCPAMVQGPIRLARSPKP